MSARLLTARQGRARWMLRAGLSAAALVLAGCSTVGGWFGSDKLAPAALTANPNQIPVRQAWQASVGKVEFPMAAQVTGNVVTVAASDGTVAAFDAATGAPLWRGSAGATLMAGVGGDGKLAAVVTRNNELVLMSQGVVQWRQVLRAEAYTAPLVAGGRVFVLGGDRSVSAFDGTTGRRLWTAQRQGDPLVLRQAGVILPVGDTLLAGQGGRLAAIAPLSGSIRWEAPVATPRGVNDIERLVDLVGRVSRVGDSVCVRAFQAAVGCVDAAKGTVQWTKPANGSQGVHGDERQVFGTEADGKVVAWRRTDGERLWSSSLLSQRGLTAPLLVGRSVAVGDAFGYLHLLSRVDGTLMQRLSTDGSPIAAAPVLAGNTLVVVTRNGGVHGFVPE